MRDDPRDPFQGMDRTHYWFDAIAAKRRERWRDGQMVEFLPAHMILEYARFPALPVYLVAPFGTYTKCPPAHAHGEYPEDPRGTGLPLTDSVNIVTVTPPSTPSPEEHPVNFNPIPAGAVAPPAAAPATASPPPDEHPVVAAVRSIIARGANMDLLTKTFLQLRERKATLDGEAKKRLGPLNDALGLIEAEFLTRFAQMGVESVNAGAGTPYILTRTSASVQDADAWQRWVLFQSFHGLPLTDAQKSALVEAQLKSGALSYFEIRAAKGPVEEHIKAHQTPPPGVKFSSCRQIGVRAA